MFLPEMPEGILTSGLLDLTVMKYQDVQLETLAERISPICNELRTEVKKIGTS